MIVTITITTTVRGTVTVAPESGSLELKLQLPLQEKAIRRHILGSPTARGCAPSMGRVRTICSVSAFGPGLSARGGCRVVGWVGVPDTPVGFSGLAGGCG